MTQNTCCLRKCSMVCQLLLWFHTTQNLSYFEWNSRWTCPFCSHYGLYADIKAVCYDQNHSGWYFAGYMTLIIDKPGPMFCSIISNHESIFKCLERTDLKTPQTGSNKLSSGAICPKKAANWKALYYKPATTSIPSQPPAATQDLLNLGKMANALTRTAIKICKLANCHDPGSVSWIISKVSLV